MTINQPFVSILTFRRSGLNGWLSRMSFGLVGKELLGVGGSLKDQVCFLLIFKRDDFATNHSNSLINPLIIVTSVVHLRPRLVRVVNKLLDYTVHRSNIKKSYSFALRWVPSEDWRAVVILSARGPNKQTIICCIHQLNQLVHWLSVKAKASAVLLFPVTLRKLSL